MFDLFLTFHSADPYYGEVYFKDVYGWYCFTCRPSFDMRGVYIMLWEATPAGPTGNPVSPSLIKYLEMPPEDTQIPKQLKPALAALAAKDETLCAKQALLYPYWFGELQKAYGAPLPYPELYLSLYKHGYMKPEAAAEFIKTPRRLRT